MKATGVVRRIDDLGRIVIPKEIRRSLRIYDGESLEIFVDNNNIVLKKFSFIRNIDEYASNLVFSLYSLIKKSVIITDSDSVIACSNNIKDLFNKPISNMMSSCIKRRESILEKYNKDLVITDDFSINCKYVINSIIANGDSIGLVVIFDVDDISSDDMLIASLASKILSKSIEE